MHLRRSGMIDKLKKFWSTQDTLEKTLFWVIMALCLVVGIFSTALSAYERVGMVSVIVGTVCCVLFIVLSIFAYNTRLYAPCHLVMCAIVCMFLQPMLFFACGGFSSAMPLYFIAGILLLSLGPSGLAKRILFVLSLTVFLATFLVASLYPQVVVPISHEMIFVDMAVSLVVLGFGVFALGSYVLRAYEREVVEKKNLVAKLDFLAKHDSLTGLKNRRHLLDYLGNIVWMQRSGYYIVMYRINNIEQLRGTYGPFFCDGIICDVGRLIGQMELLGGGECVAYFGNHDFVHVMQSESEAETLTRAERFRDEVTHLSWAEHPDVHITVSGIVAACNGHGFTNTTQLLQTVYGQLSHFNVTDKDTIRKI